MSSQARKADSKPCRGNSPILGRITGMEKRERVTKMGMRPMVRVPIGTNGVSKS
jgi:hypothetical protein